MDWSIITNGLQAFLGLAIIGLVLIQRQDTGFYSSGSNINRSRRGIEKFTYNTTIVVVILFITVSIANFII